MSLNLLSAAVLILSFGLLAQALAAYVRLPAILTLLPTGLLVGPILGWVDPDAIFGDQLLPFVSFAVAIVLFEGGSTLQLKELSDVGRTVRNLVTVGTVVAWFAITYTAFWIIGLDLRLCYLIGAILVVTGPTVIGPLLRQIRLSKRLAASLKWEGILIDPLGAMLAVLVYEAIIAPDTAITSITQAVLKAAFIGGGTGIAASALLIGLFRYRVIPEFLNTYATLTMVIGSYTVANIIQPESGLLTVTLMGIIVSNQKTADVKRITVFKEHLTVILVSVLFIILAARIDLELLLATDYQTFLFILALIFLVRPLTVFASAWRSEMVWKELLFMAFMAPRGIVAAAVSSIFALRLATAGFENSERILNVIFLVILLTGVIYSILSRFMANYLRLGSDNPQGLLIVGADKLAREIAVTLQDLGVSVLMVDANRKNYLKARLSNLTCYYGNVLNENLIPHEQLLQIGQVLAMTPNDEANSLAVLHYSEIFEKGNLFQLAPDDRSTTSTEVPLHLRGKYAFGANIGFEELMELLRKGAVVKATQISSEFPYSALLAKFNAKIIPMFFVSEEGRLTVFSSQNTVNPKAGDTIVSLQLEPTVQSR